jgi:pyruvate dehydrogenase E2 component (dihydrolipoamide acetyltransferase)
VPAAPSTRRLARELEVDLREVEPRTGEGPVTADDVRAFAEGMPRETKRAEEGRREPGERPSPLPDFGRWGPVTREPLRSIRRATARQMARAWAEIPHVMHKDVADITELERFRRDHKSAIEKQGGKLTLTVLAVKAAIAALKQYPHFNATLDLENDEIIVKQYHHIGVAVATDQGLLVPVVRDADRKNITELSIELSSLADKARAGKASREEMQGGTFTITNPGSFGGSSFTPIINHPEAAILGLGKAQLEPVVLGNMDEHDVVVRLRLPLCLVYDHRLNDGAVAAQFLRTIIEALSDPESFLLSV